METNTLESERIDVFWGEMSPCEHVVQVYHEDGAFLDCLTGFVAGGIKAGDAVVVIATSAHLVALEVLLIERRVNLAEARSGDRYIPLSAEEILSRFMVEGWPDEERFLTEIMQVVNQARRGGRRVRAFGEMVALLWEQGRHEATFRLEHLWHELCRKEAFSLFCAYPRIGFTKDPEKSMKEICEAHSRVMNADELWNRSSAGVDEEAGPMIRTFPQNVRCEAIRFVSFDSRTVVAFEKEKRRAFRFASHDEMVNALEELVAREECAPDGRLERNWIIKHKEMQPGDKENRPPYSS